MRIAKSSKTKKSSRGSRTKSLTEQYAELTKHSQNYLEAYEELSPDEIKATIKVDSFIPMSKGRNKRITCDSMFGQPMVTEAGPIPYGWREQVPSHLMNLRGPIGKALKHFGARNFYLGDQINAWFDQNCFINKADSMPGEDAVAAGYSMKKRGGADKKLITTLEDLFHTEEFNLNETMREFDHHKRCYGASIMVPCFEEPVDMENPFTDWSQLKGNRFLGWTVIEPYYLSPDFEEGSREVLDPTYKYYMVPTHWNVYGITATGDQKYQNRIHRSWIFFRRNVITAKIYQVGYKYQGPSIPQMIVERLYSAEVCANESSMLLRSKRSFVMEADIRKMVANPEYAKKFLKNCAANSDNWGVRVVPRNSNAKQMDSYLSECMPLTTAQYGILCAEVDIPAPKFMMAQLTGFANSGDYEIKLYAQKERNLQNEELIPIIKQSVRFYTACETGKPVEVDVTFNDVDVPTIAERADMLYENARAQKFAAEAEAVKKMSSVKSAESHKAVSEREGL